MNESTEPSEPVQGKDETGTAANFQDLLSGLSFGPGWARGERDANRMPISRMAGDEGVRDRKSARRGQDSGRGPRRENRPGSDGKSRAPAQPRREDFRDDRSAMPRLPVEISFIPDRDYLGAVVRQIHGTKRAYPLAHLARLFLSKPEHHMIKVEARGSENNGEGTALHFFQDKESKAVFLSEPEWLDYVKSTHLAAHFDRVEQAVEPPAGNFTCIGQCKRSGILLGPPNYHGYAERLLEVHRARFPRIPVDEYRNSVEMVRDPAMIEKWKDETRIQIRYRAKGAGENDPLLTLAQAESVFIEKHAVQYRHSGSKVIVPATAFALIGDARLKQSIQSARHREDRFPLSLMLALRPAFKHMRLHLFKTGGDETYVAPFLPKTLEAEHIIPAIKDMLEMISSNPGITKNAIAEKLHPGKPADDPVVAESLNPLVWLVDRGHVVEFYNGRLAIPGHWKSNDEREMPASSAGQEPPAGEIQPVEDSPASKST